MTQPISVIGLGVMGQRMLDNMARYPGFNAVAAFDPSAEARAHTAAKFPQLRIPASAYAAINNAVASCVYIACPPQYHAQYARAAFEAGKGVYCEKPLGVDIEDSRALAQQANASGQTHIVNFSLASAAATAYLEQQLRSGATGDIIGVDVRVHFATWPRAWQMDAASWLSYRQEGGFTREVLSHWVYLSQRLFGALQLQHSWVRYPGDDLAETHLHAALQTATFPVTIAASSGGIGPDLVEYSIWGTNASYRIVDWNRLYVSAGSEGWQPALTEIADPRERGYELQLQNASAAFAKQAHSMPNFDDALSVQTLIESMLEE